MEPLRKDVLGPFYLMAAGVDRQALMEEDFPIGTLSPAYKNYQVVLAGKLCDVGHPVGYLPANGIEAAEGSCGSDVLLDIVGDTMEFVDALGGL